MSRSIVIRYFFELNAVSGAKLNRTQKPLERSDYC